MNEGAEEPAVHELVRGFTGGVVAAGGHARLEVDTVPAKALEHFERISPKERQVVCGMHRQHLAWRGREQVHKGDWADAGPDSVQLLLGHHGFARRADMAAALAGPHHVAEGHGGVIEGADLQTRIHGGGEEGVAGTEAGAEDAELLVALLLEPVNAGADIDHSLAAGGYGAAEIGTDGVVGTLELRGTADVVVGLGEPQGRDAEAIEERAESVMTEGVGIPLRPHDDGLPGLA